MKSILLNADKDTGWASRYTVALALARAFSGWVHCVQSTPLADTGESFFGYFPYPEIAREIQERGRQHRNRAEVELRESGVQWDWLEVMGAQTEALTWRSGLADIIVLSSGAKQEGALAPDFLELAGTVVTHVRTPILAVPPDIANFDPLGTALVAWNGAPEAANALRGALPVLKHAKKVVLLTASEDDDDARRISAADASVYLARHDIQSKQRLWPRKDRHAAEAVLDAAGAFAADYIVAGAYGHTRLRETVLGGATRGLLRDSPVPLLMAH
jgi:nucleotide-binding universal stress UspA family protein